MKNILFPQSMPISNSLILNNYSIQNLIISPTKIVAQMKTPLLHNNYILSHKNSFSPSPHKNIIKNIPMMNDLNPNNNYRNRNFTPLSSYKGANRINCINLKSFSSTPININSNENLAYSPKNRKVIRTEEKHPEDSKKIRLKKINQTNFKPNQKMLKNSISQRVFQTIKKPYGIMNNLTMTQVLKKNELEPHNRSKNKIINIKREPCNTKIGPIEPKGNINLEEYQLAEPIGKGTFGTIFCVRWNKNNKLYALKKEILTDKETIDKRKESFEIIQNFIKKTKSKGVIRLYANLFLKNLDLEYQYYELMEKAERDWDQEINVRAQYNLYYKESEIINIMKQLVSTLALLQKNHITHRDIKPQNILVIKQNYKLCDFGEIRVLKRNGLIVQRVRGSELYMSPILFHGLHLNLLQVKHNTYKSDVFSLGMCLFYASSLTYIGVDSIRELTNMQRIKEILFKHLGKRYSQKYIMLILLMLEVNEEKRPDFIQLEMKIRKKFS